MITLREYLNLYSKSPFYAQYKGAKKDQQAMIEYNKALIARYPFLLPRNVWTDKVADDFNYAHTLMDAMPEGWRIAWGDKLLEEIREELVKYNYLDEYRVIQIKEKYGTLRWYDAGIPIGKLSDTYREVSAGLEEVVELDPCTEYKEEVNRENYTSRDEIGELGEEGYNKWKEANKNCVIRYRIYRIVERCKIHDITNKYENLSAETCIDCGAMNVPLYKSKGWINIVCRSCAEKRLEEYNKYPYSNYYPQPVLLTDAFTEIKEK